ncbi:MAG: dTDP-glucose 4,6-dehydratase, partial [Candidatus Methylomirabilales bacterium]
PYAASKAAADLLCRAYGKTYGLPVIITRSSNNYGPWQFPEKLIPLFITNALEGRPLPLYGDGLYLREWLSVEDHCEALDLVLHKGRPGEIYNIGGTDGWPNLEIAKLILRELGLPESLLIHVQDRPGHDRRYALDSTKITQELGWTPRRPLAEGLKETIRWYQANQDWWQAVKAGGAFQEYYKRRYGELAR